MSLQMHNDCTFSSTSPVGAMINLNLGYERGERPRKWIAGITFAADHKRPVLLGYRADQIRRSNDRQRFPMSIPILD